MSHGGGMKHSATSDEIRERALRLSYEEQSAEITRLRAEVEMLRAVLEPFAEAATWIENTNPHLPERKDADFVSSELHPSYHSGKKLLVGDFRRARRILADTEETEGT